MRQFEKTKPIIEQNTEFRRQNTGGTLTDPGFSENPTTNPRSSAQSAVLFEKIKPISAKTRVSSFVGEDYEDKPRPGLRENKPKSPACGGKS